MKVTARGMVVLGIVSATLCIAALAADEGEAKEFGGDFQTGLFFRCGDTFAMAPMFMDKKRPPVIQAADDKVSDELLKDICTNGADLRIAPAVARSMAKQQTFQGNPYGEALHIAVFPHDGIAVGEKLKATARFKPGALTKVAQVVEKYGKAPEREAWIAKDFQSWIGLNGMVYWWGSVGIAGSSDGTITHVLIREKEGVLDAAK
jgi:hypothetical protein